MKLITYKKLAASVADFAKGEFSKFCETVVIENKEEFLSFDKYRIVWTIFCGNSLI